MLSPKLFKSVILIPFPIFVDLGRPRGLCKTLHICSFRSAQNGSPLLDYRPDCTSNPSDGQVDSTPLEKGIEQKMRIKSHQYVNRYRISPAFGTYKIPSASLPIHSSSRIFAGSR